MIKWCCAKHHFNSLLSLGTKPAADKSTPNVYLLPHCRCVRIDRASRFIWRRDGISQAQTPCSTYECNTYNIYLTEVLPKPALHRLSMKCVKLKEGGLLFMCTEWIKCSHSCLFWGCNTHSWALQPWANSGHCLLYQLELHGFLIIAFSFYSRFIHVDPNGNKSQLFLLIKRYCGHKGEGGHWIFTLDLT